MMAQPLKSSLPPGGVIAVCGLCRTEKNLVESHVIPAFVYRWLRETGGTGGFIRNSKNPNVRIQDGLKFPLLCRDCEALFNSFETPFATKLFHPFSDDFNLKAYYEEWLLKFCVSVSWRILRYARNTSTMGELSPNQVSAADDALDRWSGFLEGRYPHPGSYEQHLLPFPGIEDHNMPQMPTNMNRYLMRAVELDVAHGGRIAFTYAKMGPFALFGWIVPPEHKWVGTKVHVRRGKFGPTTYELPKNLYDFLAHKARCCAEAMNELSERQIQKIDDAALKNIDSLMGSKQFEAMLQDAKLFGEQAITRKPRRNA